MPELVPEPTKKNPANLPSRTEFEATLERWRASVDAFLASARP